MDIPPPFGDPYEAVPAGQSNPGSVGVVVGWDAVRYFHGTVLGQAWADLENIITGGVLV